jgi:hypothetical protein
MSTSTISAPHSERAAPENPRSRKWAGEPSLYARYVGAMLYFVGAALIAGAVVHYPIDPPVYTVICIAGALVFLLGTVVNEFIFAAERPTVTRAIALVTFSLLLSFGVGLLGGGIQHFEQFPERSAAMTPLGLLMSYAAFVAKDPQGRWRNVFSLFGAGVVGVAVATWFGMNAIATSMEPISHDHSTGTGTGSGETPADQAPADQVPAGQDDAPTENQDVPVEPGHDDSHSH